MMKPILKWAGGKTQLLPELLKLIPEYETYYEPFVGGGALFFALEPDKSVISDFNPQLINVYKQVKRANRKLIEKLDTLKEEHTIETDYFYERREDFNECIRRGEFSVDSAALLIYLNKACYNGLYRLNASGEFNTPSGKRKRVKLYDSENFEAVSKLLKRTEIRCGDFADGCRGAKSGDFVFFDSPYYNTFDTYQAGGFSEEDHKRLAELFRELSGRGVKCLLTNSDEDFIKNLYKDYHIKTVDVKRMINCDGKNRVGKEIIVRNYDD